MRFGGYTEQKSSNGNGIWKKDNKAFCFSIELNKIYNIIKGRDAIFCCSYYMCYFGDNIFVLMIMPFLLSIELIQKNSSNYGGQEKDYELTNEENNSFSLDEVEVFEISFDWKIVRLF